MAQSKAHPRSDGSKRTAFLVSSIGKSAGEKLVQLVEEFVPTPTVLTVLSPYHDKDVRASRKLQNEIRPKKMQYALGQTGDGNFLAPFAIKIKQDTPKNFVTPRLAADKGCARPLHAKWFDVCNETGAAVSMTGSVNATYKSLWTTDNVELAMARVTAIKRSPIWKAITGAPIYEPCEFPSTIAVDTTVLCKASLSLSFELEIEFRPKPAAGFLKIRLSQGQATLYEQSELQYSGRTFTLGIPVHVVKSLKDGALWVDVVGVDSGGQPVNCQSWVNVEQELERKPTEVDVYKAMNRLEQGQYAADDEYLLLAAIHFELTGRKLNKNGGSPRRGGADKPVESPDVMTKTELDANHNLHGVFGGKEGTSRILRMLQLMAQKIKADDGPLPEGDGECPTPDESGDTDDQVDDDDEAFERDPGETQAEKRRRKKKKDAVEAVARARQTLDDALKKAFGSPMSESKANWLIPYKLGIDLQAKFPITTTHHVGEGANVGRTLLATIRLCAKTELEPRAKKNLLQTLACAAAATCLAYKRLSQMPPYDEVLSMLEEFVGREITLAELQTLPSQNFPGKAYIMLDSYDWPDLLPELTNIAQALRLGARINQLLKFALVEAVPRPDAITPAEESFIRGLREARNPKYKLYAIVTALDVSNFSEGCPQCNQRLSGQEATRLRTYHIAMCEGSCRRPIVERTKPMAQHEFYKQEEAYIAPQRREVER